MHLAKSVKTHTQKIGSFHTVVANVTLPGPFVVPTETKTSMGSVP